MAVSEENEWLSVLRAAIRAQQIIPGAVTVGGTAAAIYARHRISVDADHVLVDLRGSFHNVLDLLSEQSDWKLFRPDPPVQILGSLGNTPVGFRQLKRSLPIETQMCETSVGALRIPTLDEMICIKAFLCCQRNQTRDYLDFAALSSLVLESSVMDSLMKIPLRYAEFGADVGLLVAQRLTQCEPADRSSISLEGYKGLKADWQNWDRVRQICVRFGHLLGEALIVR